jgi:hypothetical protein
VWSALASHRTPESCAAAFLTEKRNKIQGSDRLTYRIPLASLPDQPASVKATLYYQAIPPFYLQDRFCTTGNQPDTERLYAMAGYLQLDGTRAARWKLALVSSGVVSLTK